MSNADATGALIQFLERLPAAKRKDLVAVHCRALRVPYLLHMSRDNEIPAFSPSVTRRSAPGEDRSIPRISTATTWAGCVLGYQSDMNDHLNQPVSLDADGREVRFKGGWVIYALPFTYAIRPGPSLVPDVNRSDEYWLVTYDKYTVQYKPTIVSRVFYEEIQIITRGDGKRERLITAVFEVSVDEGLAITGRAVLGRGYWRVKFRDLHSAASVHSVDIVTVDEITVDDYTQAKNVCAGLLSYNPVPPSSLLNWT